MFSATWRRYLYLLPLNTSKYLRNTTPTFDNDIIPETVYYFPVTGMISAQGDGLGAPEDDVDVDVNFVNDTLQR